MLALIQLSYSPEPNIPLIVEQVDGWLCDTKDHPMTIATDLKEYIKTWWKFLKYQFH